MSKILVAGVGGGEQETRRIGAGEERVGSGISKKVGIIHEALKYFKKQDPNKNPKCFLTYILLILRLLN